MKIGWTEKLGYAAGDMASCLYFGIFMNFLAIFYTDVFGIAPAALGTMLLFVRTWDWINDPIMGAIADRTETKMGKFRPWLLWMIVPYMIFGVLTFTTVDWSPTMKLVYAYFTYTTLMMIYTAINVPYGALMGVMTAKSEERTVLAAYRFVGANAGIFAVTLMLPYLVKTIGRGDEQFGYSGAMVIIALLAGGLFYFTFKTCKERVRQVDQKQESIREELQQLARNGPWLVVIAISILTVMGQAIRATTTLHYFKYNVGNEAWGTSLLLYNSVMAVIAVLLSKSFCKLIGCKRRAYVILNLLFAGLLVWFYFIPVTSFPLMLANQLLIALVAAPMMPIFWSMIADTADYGAVKFGHRSTGVIFSAGTASQKIGWTVGPAVALMFLGGAGYVANAEQNPATLNILRLEMSLIPAVFAVLTAIVTCFYKIDRQLELELEAAILKQTAAPSQA
jgi:GPH family glycoside/pentoside/hexuronide:cation symporter